MIDELGTGWHKGSIFMADIADIFISWSQDDADVVRPVVNRLRAYGWKLYFSGDNAEAGRIDENVAAAMVGASAMVLFVSPRTHAKPWLRRESEWAAFVQARQRSRKKRRVLKLIPVLIGNVKVDQLNYFLAQDNNTLRVSIPEPVPVVPGQAFADNSGDTLRVADGAFGEASIRNLVTRIHNAIELPPPISIPVVLLAMTFDQAKHHFEIAGNPERLNGLCKLMGMTIFPDLRQELLKRYGATPDDFCPFEENQRIKDVLEAARSSLNESLPDGSSPVELWWCREEFFVPGRNRELALRQVANGPLLIVLDSISIILDSIAPQSERSGVLERYNTVAATHQSAPSALLWVPPYTSHTKCLRSLWSAILDPTPALLARLEMWGAKPADPQELFDIGTAESLRAWSFGGLRTLGAQRRPKNRGGGGGALLSFT